MKKLREGVDYYYNADGYVVLTEIFHLERGECCGNGCLHCPYDYRNVPEPNKTLLLAQRKNRGQKKEKES